MRAVREDTIAAQAVGITVLPTRLSAFVARRVLRRRRRLALRPLSRLVLAGELLLRLHLRADQHAGDRRHAEPDRRGHRRRRRDASLSEVLRNLERGFDLGAFAIPPLYGASQIVLGMIFILVMIFRPTRAPGRPGAVARPPHCSQADAITRRKRTGSHEPDETWPSGPAAVVAALLLASAGTARAADTIKIGAPFNVTGALSSLDAPGAQRRQAEGQGDQRRRRRPRQADRARRLRHQDRSDRDRQRRQPAHQPGQGPGRRRLHRFRLGAGARADLPAGRHPVRDARRHLAEAARPGRQRHVPRLLRRQRPGRGRRRIRAKDKLNGQNVYLLARQLDRIHDAARQIFQGGLRAWRRQDRRRGRLQDAATSPSPPRSPSSRRSRSKPDVLYVAAMPDDIGLVVKQMRQAGVTQPIVGGDGYDTPLLLSVGGEAANNVYYSTHAYMARTATAGDPEVLHGLQGGLRHGAGERLRGAGLRHGRPDRRRDQARRRRPTRPRSATRSPRPRATPGITGTISYPEGHPRAAEDGHDDRRQGRQAHARRRGHADLDARPVSPWPGADLAGSGPTHPSALEPTTMADDPVARLMAGLAERQTAYLRFELPDLHGVSRSKTVPIDKVEDYARRGLNFYGGVLGLDTARTWSPAAASTATSTMPTSPLPRSRHAARHPLAACHRQRHLHSATGTTRTEPQRAAPRWVLRPARRRRPTALGYDVLIGHEYEYYLLRADTKERLYEGIHIFHTVRNQYAPFLDQLVPTAPALRHRRHHPQLRVCRLAVRDRLRPRPQPRRPPTRRSPSRTA